MLIEVIRALKRKELIQLVDDIEERHKIAAWVDTHVLEDDEMNIYNDILKKLRPGTKWGS